MALIIVGAILLLLPISHNGYLSPIDALFTSTSAICVTGLIVKDTANDFTIFGQSIIIILIQIGGLGYMAAVTFLAIISKQKLSHRDRVLLKESLNYPDMKGLVRFLKIVFASIVIIEIIGAIILTLRFLYDMPADQAVWFGVFHAISAFNNAGFSLFDDNLMRYSTDITINLTIPTLIILGGLGYMVLIELRNYYKKDTKRLSTHTKLVITMYILLIVAGMILLLTLEWNTAFKGMNIGEKIMASWFASVNYRTAGFNTIDLSKLSEANLFFATFFMMTGGAPGGTAGGIKVIPVALAVIGTWYALKGDDNVHVFKRTISHYNINKAYAMIFLASIYVVISTIILSESEHLPFLRTLFETCSAFGTVGLSTGNGGVLSYSALFSNVGKVNIMLLMLAGRIGVFAFTVAIIGKFEKSRIKYAEGRVVL